jgi:cell fate regulator YaaT (PSP1 superfamily)
LPLNPDEISGVCGRLLCCLSYEDLYYKEQNKKMPKLGAEVVTPQGVGRVRHVHPLKESVTVMLENSVLAEFAVSELITSKSSSGGSCGTCGGCTVKRRASAEEDNARLRKQMAARALEEAEVEAAAEEDDAEDTVGDETGAVADATAPGGRSKRRRRRRPRQKRTGGDKTVD